MTLGQPDYDIVIVGAGPAGATTAKCLLDQKPDARVLLVDKAKMLPRDKPCGGFVGPQVLDTFPYLQGHEDHFIESESFAGILHSPDLRYQVGGRTRMFGVLRSTFDNYLVGVARRAGVHIGINHKVHQVSTHDNGVSIQFAEGGTVTTRLVVGADGAASLVARRTGIHQGWQPHEICRTVVKEFSIDSSFINEQCGPDRPIHLYLQFNQTPGYAWYFPKVHHINVGLGCFANYPIKIFDYFQLFLRLLRNQNMLPPTSTARGAKAGICPVMGPLEITQANRVLLVGDAAGFVSPATGAGILPGMISGQLAADTLAEALTHQRFDAGFLRRYQIRWEQQIGRFHNELIVQRLFLTRFCNLFIRIGEQDAAIRELISSAQTHAPDGSYASGVSIPHLLGRVIWDLLKGAFGLL